MTDKPYHHCHIRSVCLFLRPSQILPNNVCFVLPYVCYQLRPPQPAAYLFVLDVSHNAVEAGYLKYFCESLLDNLDK